MRLAIFEDKYVTNLFPLVHLRAACEIRFGVRSLLEKHRRLFPDAELTLHCRDELHVVLSERFPEAEVNGFAGDSYLFLNGRALLTDESAGVLGGTEDALYINDGRVVAARLSGSNLEPLRAAGGKLLDRSDFPDLNENEMDCGWIDYPWDLVLKNGPEIEREFEGGGIGGKVHDGAMLIEPENISISEGAVIKPGAIIDAEDGPVIIASGAKVLPNAYVQGPAFIGEKSLIKVGAKIYEGTSIGEVCKVGGEVEESIIHAYSNKQHDGFLGHAYLGMWVNLGGGTENSDLKNNYSNVRFYLDEKNAVDTGSKFVGLMMGDHSKSGINTSFNTGTHIGICCNMFGSGFPPKFVPSFSWGGAEGIVEYRWEKAVETSRRVMGRRDVTLSAADENLMKFVFDRAVRQRENVD